MGKNFGFWFIFSRLQHLRPLGYCAPKYKKFDALMMTGPKQSRDSNLAWLNGLSNSFLCALLSSLLFYFISLHSCIDVLFLGALAFCISVYFISSSVSFLLAFLFVSLFLSLSFLSHRHTLASKQQLSSEMKWCVDWDIISPRFIWSPLTLVASALNSRTNILTIIASSLKSAETPSSPASTSYQSHLFDVKWFCSSWQRCHRRRRRRRRRHRRWCLRRRRSKFRLQTITGSSLSPVLLWMDWIVVAGGGGVAVVVVVLASDKLSSWSHVTGLKI